MKAEEILNEVRKFLSDEIIGKTYTVIEKCYRDNGILTRFEIIADRIGMRINILYNTDEILSVAISTTNHVMNYHSPNVDQVIPMLSDIIRNGDQCAFFVYRSVTPENLTDEHRDILASIMCRYDDFCGTTSSWENWIMVDSHVFVLRPVSVSTLISVKHEKSGYKSHIDCKCVHNTISYLQKAVQECIEKSEEPEKKPSNQGDIYTLIENIDSRLNKIETTLKTILEETNNG